MPWLKPRGRLMLWSSAGRGIWFSSSRQFEFWAMSCQVVYDVDHVIH